MCVARELREGAEQIICTFILFRRGRAADGEDYRAGRESLGGCENRGGVGHVENFWIERPGELADFVRRDLLHFREFLHGGGAGGEEYVGGEQRGVAARRQRLPDFDAVSHHDDFRFWREAFHPESDGREIGMRGENDERFLTGVLQRGENEAQLGATETTEGDFVFAG